MDSLTERLRQLDQLPAEPGVLVELSVALSQLEVSSAEIERIISLDSALALAVLRRSNSAAYGASSCTSSLCDAVTRLGKSDLLRIAAAQLREGPLDDAGRSYGLHSGEAWRAARAGALAAASIGTRTDLAAPGVCFTAALLRDCGKLAMDYLVAVGELESALIARPADANMIELERSAFGFDHAEVGAELALQWGLSIELAEAIRHHHAPPSEGGCPLVDIVHCADAVCSMLGLGVGLDGLGYPLDADAQGRLGLGLEEMYFYMSELAVELEGLDPAC